MANLASTSSFLAHMPNSESSASANLCAEWHPYSCSGGRVPTRRVSGVVCRSRTGRRVFAYLAEADLEAAGRTDRPAGRARSAAPNGGTASKVAALPCGRAGVRDSKDARGRVLWLSAAECGTPSSAESGTANEGWVFRILSGQVQRGRAVSPQIDLTPTSPSVTLSCDHR